MTSRAPWVEVLAATAVGVAELAAAIALHVWFDELPHDERPVPLLDRLPFVLAALALFALAFGCWRVWRRRAELRAGTVAAIFVQVVLTLGGGAAVIGSDPDFLFGPRLDDSIDLPDGRSAHLYRGGLFCSYEVFLAAPDDLFAFRTRYISAKDCSEPGHLVLDGDGIAVVDAHGEPLRDDGADWAALFDWAPH